MIIDGGDSMEGVQEKPISHEDYTLIEKMWWEWVGGFSATAAVAKSWYWQSLGVLAFVTYISS
jgi:uncharacterized membrane protein YdcZ (DUF606 family)